MKRPLIVGRAFRICRRVREASSARACSRRAGGNETCCRLGGTVNWFILCLLLGNIGSYDDLTSGRRGQQARVLISEFFKTTAGSRLTEQPPMATNYAKLALDTIVTPRRSNHVHHR
jgi:hypothetical protein